MSKHYSVPWLPLPYDLETKAVLRQANIANKKLAELKGVATTIPNEGILISTLTLQEAKESSAIESIVTTHDDLYRAEIDIHKDLISASTKEVLNYRQAILFGFDMIRKDKVLSANRIKQIQEHIEHNRAGFRTLPGTTLKDSQGAVVYTPPQSAIEIEEHMANLEAFINNNAMSDYDPLIKMAIIHHQFESIHPFYDANGRTGRIVNILYLIINDLLDLPILYLSRFVTQNKGEYYRLMQAIRDKDGDNSREWEAWVLFILRGVERTAEDTILLVKGISQLMGEYKAKLRPLFGKQYKHELLNNLFFHPYTKIDFMARDLMVGRKSATKYLDTIVAAGLLSKIKMGRENYYMNDRLADLFFNIPTAEH